MNDTSMNRKLGEPAPGLLPAEVPSVKGPLPADAPLTEANILKAQHEIRVAAGLGKLVFDISPEQMTWLTSTPYPQLIAQQIEKMPYSNTVKADGSLVSSHIRIEHTTNGKTTFETQPLLLAIMDRAKNKDMQNEYGDTKLTHKNIVGNIQFVAQFHQDRLQQPQAAPVQGADAAPDAKSPSPSKSATGGSPAHQTTHAKKHWPRIDTAVQFDLESLGLPTGQPAGWDASKGAAEMDGRKGPKTSGSIAQFKTDHPEFAQLSGADLYKKIHEAAEAKRQQAPAPETAPAANAPAPAAAAPAGSKADPLAALVGAEQANAIRALHTTPYTVKDMAPEKDKALAGALPDEVVKSMLPEKSEEYVHVKLTDAQLASVTVKNGVIAAPIFGVIQHKLGLTETGTVDEQLAAAFKDAKVQAFAKQIILSDAQTASAPATTPGKAANAPTEQARR